MQSRVPRRTRVERKKAAVCYIECASGLTCGRWLGPRPAGSARTELLGLLRALEGASRLGVTLQLVVDITRSDELSFNTLAARILWRHRAAVPVDNQAQ
jgi:hypothetical protein